MKILFFNTFYFPNMIGGTENSVKILAENLVKNNHKVYVISADNELDNDIKIENINGVQIYRVKPGKFDIKSRMRGTESLKRKIANKIIELNNYKVKDIISKIIQDIKPDIIHTNNLYGFSPIIWKIAKENHIKLVHTIRDYWIIEPIKASNIIIKSLNKFIKKKFRKLSNNVDIVTAPSNYTLNKVINEKYFSKAVQICVFNAINLNLEETINIIEERKNRNSKNIKFMYVGMLTEEKGLINLINAFSRIEKKDISLNIFGDGILKNFIQESCKKDDRIKYYGKLKAEDLKKYWLENDVLIVSSVWEEPFGRVVIEGNQYGLPVIGSNRAGILETIKNINTGELYQYDNIEELAKTIEKFIDRNHIKYYYKNIIENIEKYSVDEQIRQFTKLYMELIEEEKNV